VALAAKYYNGIGLNVDDIIGRSDLFEKPGKNQHAYCTDIDRAGDVRVLCNVKPTYSWMNTTLHELGHGVYSKFNDPAKPYLLRDAAHSFTTEAIAQIMGRCASNPQWMLDMGLITPEQKQAIADDSFNSLRLEQLTFSRWAQVMYRFEKEMYANPDQDLNALWWTLVEKYQLLKKPEGRNEPDWASKIHVALYPCYYHNYLMGELLASQLYYYIADNVIKNSDYRNVSFVNHPEVGKYLDEKVFKPGCLYLWNDMIERATGEKLTAKYYAKQFVD
jgi:peptidyl-dipeptidase A